MVLLALPRFVRSGEEEEEGDEQGEYAQHVRDGKTEDQPTE
jgi:hypothetical protein